MNKEKTFNLIFQILKIILTSLILLSLTFFSYKLISIKLNDLANIGKEGYHSGLGLYVFASHIIFLCINFILFVLGCACWIVLNKCKSMPNCATYISAFRFLTFAPIISEIIYFILNLIVVNIV